MDIIFLDANVLFSAAFRKDTKLRRLWELQGIKLITSAYALEEARRNLDRKARRDDLEQLMRRVSLAPAAVDPDTVAIDLPEKDRPILAAAIAAGATHLLTGDFRHFGPHYGKQVAGVLILPPAAYLSALQE